MLSWPTKMLLFVSSYLPLWIIFAVVDGTKLGHWVLVPIACIILGAAGLATLRWWESVSAPIPLTAEEAYRLDTENVAYILTYIFPFIGQTLSDPLTAIGLAAIFVVVALVYVGSDMIYVNPVLTLWGWHVFRVVSKKGNEHVVMVQEKMIRKGDTLGVVPLSEGLWRAKSRAGQGSIRAPDPTPAT